MPNEVHKDSVEVSVNTKKSTIFASKAFSSAQFWKQIYKINQTTEWNEIFWDKNHQKVERELFKVSNWKWK